MTNRKDLQEYRTKLNAIDSQIADLCRQRLLITEEVFRLKKNLSLPLQDAEREMEIRGRFAKQLLSQSEPRRIDDLVQCLLNLSPDYPQS